MRNRSVGGDDRDEGVLDSFVWSQEIKSGFLNPYLDVLESALGREGMETFLERWGVKEDELRDETAWVSLRFVEEFIDALVELHGSDEVVIRGGRENLTPKYMGSAYPILRMFGTPALVYSRFGDFLPSINKVTELTTIESGPSSIVLSFGLRSGYAEHSPHLCTGRRAQLAAIPTLWGLPEAQVTERQCRWDGHEACVYEISWQRRLPHIATFVGLALDIGLVVGLLSVQIPLLTTLLAALLVLLVGASVDQWRRLREVRRFTEVQHQRLVGLNDAAERRFVQAVSDKQKRLEAEEGREKLSEHLRMTERLASVGTLAAGVAHELNNPLAAIRANLNYIEEKVGTGAPSSEIQKAAEEALEGVDRAGQIVKQLGLFSLTHKPVTELVNVTKIMDSALIVADNELRHRAKIVKDYDKVARVEADPGQLGQVFLNLLLNAAYALPTGRAGVHEVKVTVAMAGEVFVVIEVRDTGEGIPVDNQDKVFDPFFTTREVGSGMGLGLTTCHALVTELGGTIELESVQNQGTTVRVILPAVHGSPTPQPPNAPGKIESRGRARILIVDDEVPLLRALGRMLGEHEVVAARSVADAKAAIDSGSAVDMILCDIMMPDDNGVEFFKWLQTHRAKLASRVVFMTGGVLSEDIRHVLDGLPNEVLDKPIDTDLLRQLVRSMLGLTQSSRPTHVDP